MIEKVKQKLGENKVYVLAAVFGVSALGAYLYFKSSSPNPPDNPSPPPLPPPTAALPEDTQSN
jgi:hypothetical protein